MGAMMGGSMLNDAPSIRRLRRSYDSLLTCHSRRGNNGFYLWYELAHLTRHLILMTESLTLVGTVNIFRYGAGTQGIMRTLGQYMAVSGTTFG